MSDAVVTLADGAGGKASRRLVEGLFVEELRNPLLEPLEDAAVVAANGARIALTTDSYVVRPLRFPGGDIGELAVNGTVNDLAVSGAAFVVSERTQVSSRKLTGLCRDHVRACAAGFPMRRDRSGEFHRASSAPSCPWVCPRDGDTRLPKSPQRSPHRAQ